MKTYYQNDQVTLYHGDALEVMTGMADNSIDCLVTSPPYYGLRDYGNDGQYGLEETPAAYINTLADVFDQAKRLLTNDGTMWLNLGDSYGRGSRPMAQPAQTMEARRNQPKSIRPQDKRSLHLPNKSLIGIPQMAALELKHRGWILRNDIIWAKPNGMPAKVSDRYHNRYEHIFLFTKKESYWFDRPETHCGDVWTMATARFPGAHFAVFPDELARRCITSGCKPGGTVLDPFSGSGTTGKVALANGRNYVGIDISADYLDLSLSTRLASNQIDNPQGKVTKV